MTTAEQKELAARIVAENSFIFEHADLASATDARTFFLAATEEVVGTLKFLLDAGYNLEVVKECGDCGADKIFFMFERNDFCFNIAVPKKNSGEDAITPEDLFTKAKEFLANPKKAAEAEKRRPGDRRPRNIVDATLRCLSCR